jgi:peptide deformylase
LAYDLDRDPTGDIVIRDIVTDTLQLSSICLPFNGTSEELYELREDLIHTALHNAKHNPMGCAGLAANQIGSNHRAFVMKSGDMFRFFLNPVVMFLCDGVKSQMEGCLSRPGEERIKVRRFKKVRLRFDHVETFTHVMENFSGLEARIIQHEMDHLNGVLI